MRSAPLKRRACALLAAVLAFSAIGAPVAQAVPGGSALESATDQADVDAVAAAERATVSTEIPVTRTKDTVAEGASNYFNFVGPGWDKSDSNHHWTNANEGVVDETYYEVKFVGSEIDIYAQRNWPLGMVSYSIDGSEPEEFGLANPIPNPNKPVLIKSYTGLEEGVEHTLTARFTGKRDPNNQNQQHPENPKNGIDAGKVVVRHAEYVPTKLESKYPAEGLKLRESATEKLDLSIEPGWITAADFNFSSNKESVARVDETGAVTAVAEGTAEITVAPKAANSVQPITIPVTVEAAPILDGFISDVDTQWTQDRLGEAQEEIAAVDEEQAGETAKRSARADEGLPDDDDTLNAWKNDSAISEITLVAGADDVNNVKIEAGDFVTADGKTIKAESVDLSFIGTTQAYNGGFLGYAVNNGPEDYPDVSRGRAPSNDILLGDDPVSVGAGQLQNIFVKVNVPKDAAAGDYTGVVTVKADGMTESLEFQYKLKVSGAALPDVEDFGKTFDVEFWQYPYTSAEYYGVEPFSDEHFEILKPIMELYKSIGGNSITTSIVEEAWNGQTYADPDKQVRYPSMIKWTQDADGQMHYDFTHFDKWVEFNLGLGIDDKITMYSIMPWQNEIWYYDASGTLIKKSTGNGSGYTNEVRGMFRHFLNALSDHLEEKGWFDIAYLGFDERGMVNDPFDLIDSVKNSKGQSIKTTGAMDSITAAGKSQIARRIDDLAIGDQAANDAGNGYDELIKYRKDNGMKTTLYSCTEHSPGNFSLSAPVESYWSLINAEKDGNTAGFLRWALDAWVDDPLHDTTHWGCEPGDCFLIYPGADKATVESKGFDNLSDEEKAPKSSIRLERMAEGVRDANKVKQIRSQAPSLSGKITDLYAGITTTPKKIRTYRTEAETKQLDAEMDAFKSGLASLTVEYLDAIKGKQVAPTELSIDGGDSIEVGQEVTMTINTHGALSTDVDWSSSNPDIASVDINGKVTAHKAGVATITAVSAMNDEAKAEKRIMVIGGDFEVAHYDFDDPTGGMVNDWAENARSNGDGVVGAAVTFTEEGMKGNAASIDGDDSNKRITLDADLYGLDGAKPWTVALWAKSTEPVERGTILFQDDDSYNGFALKAADGDHPAILVVNDRGGNDRLTLGGPTFEDNRWYRIALVYDPAVGTSLYVDGRFVESKSWTAEESRPSNMKLPLGNIGGQHFTGLIDELAVYSRALTASEIKARMGSFTEDGEATGELGLETTEKTIYEGESFGISGNFGPDVKFSVEQKNVADDEGKVVTVSKDGVVSGDLRGNATITVIDNGKTDTMKVRVKRNISISNQVPTPILDETKYVTDLYGIEQMKTDGNWDAGKTYYGQADMVRTRDGKLVTCFPQGHGVGKAMVRISDDDGATWREPKNGTPACFDQSRETPTIYALDMPDGKERLIIISANPKWSTGDTGERGWNTSVSDDGGETWSEYKRFHEKITVNGQEIENPVIVGMASLVQLRDDNGRPMNKWMGIYHHGHDSTNFTNFKTYLTFEKGENGEWVEKWSEPELLLPNSREIEKQYQMCEIGMFRSPDGGRIIGLCRSQSHNNPSTLIYSDDEGKTWSEPMDLPGSLSGERHKPFYDPQTGLIVIPFRGIRFDTNYDNKFGGGNDWTCDDWDMWVGTYEQLMNQEDGLFRMRLDEDFARTTYSGDCGYTGIAALDDGTLVMDSYGHWDRDYTNNWTDPNTGSYNVYTDYASIRQAKFSLKDVLVEDGYAVPAELTVDLGFGEQAVSSQWVTIGDKLLPQLPEVPQRDGYRFDGWMLDDGTNLTAVDGATTMSQKCAVRATWTKVTDPTPLEFWVAFDLNYEGAPEAQLLPVKDGKVSAPANPARDGYAFEGWFTDAACTAAFDFESKVESNMRLYAKWAKVDVPGGGTGGDGGNGGQGGNGGNQTDGPGDTGKPGAKPNGGLPGTGDDSLLPIVGAAIAGTAVLAGGATLLLRKRKNQ